MESRKITIFVFFSLIFLFVIIYLFLWMYQAYDSSTGFADSTTDSTINCLDYMFDLKDISYNNSLEFIIYNRGVGKFIDELILSSGDEEDILVLSIYSGESLFVNSSLTVVDNVFDVYVPSCDIYKKSFSLD
jgi:hypothetical protein